MLSLVITSHILEANKQLLQDKSNWNGLSVLFLDGAGKWSVTLT